MKLATTIRTDVGTISPAAGQGNAVFSTGMQKSVKSRNRSIDNKAIKRGRKNLQGLLAGDSIGESLENLDMNGVSSLEQVRKKSSSGKLLTLPTILTLARVVAVPTLVAVFYCTEWWASTLGVTIFVVACITDWLDGYLARKMKSSSAFGAFLDPVADKLMVATALVLLCTRPPSMTWFSTVPWLVSLPAIAIIGREITMSAVREWAAAQGGELHKAVAVNSLGKAKTASQMVALTLLLASRDAGVKTGVWTAILGIGLLYVSAVLALWSLGVYMKGLWGSMFRCTLWMYTFSQEKGPCP
ncbi:hypothetical protein O6H91_12G024400 [Diphasiastrum complanatum]|uniref:Uncharacterized protein n=1 Tax=Diphasiastrum complanatum TaxID=34168 RepID=A0ACC2BZQ0_DIPCM|nr:hypothetical protein O6H91_12G024400 [Diphasiastrum complanatum]